MSDPVNYRLKPPISHRDYLILSDLLAWFREAAVRTEGPVLDFGCDASPYRSLFGDRPYVRADIPGPVGLDYVIGPDERISAPDGAFGTVISTQVLEHVDLFREYLAEAHRVLRPGGRLLLSTHGTFEEHGHPHDFRRWTLTCLGRDLERAGFVIESADKLTVGPRALHYLMGSQMWKMNPSRKSVLGYGLSLLRRHILHRPGRWNAFADRHYAAFCRLPGPGGEESLFIGIAFVARKP